MCKFPPTTIKSESSPFHGCYFLFFLDPLTDGFWSTLNLFAELWIEFSWAYLIVAVLNSILHFWRPSPLWDISWFSLMSSIISTNSNVTFAKMKLKFCFCFEKSNRIWTTFYRVDSKQARSSSNSMQSNSFFFDNKKMARTRDDECCEFRIIHQIKFQSLIRVHHLSKNVWSPCKGETLKAQLDHRDEAQENDK